MPDTWIESPVSRAAAWMLDVQVGDTLISRYNRSVWVNLTEPIVVLGTEQGASSQSGVRYLVARASPPGATTWLDAAWFDEPLAT